jgi:hypothetical protein
MASGQGVGILVHAILQLLAAAVSTANQRFSQLPHTMCHAMSCVECRVSNQWLVCIAVIAAGANYMRLNTC